MQIREIQTQDWPAILVIQDECYPNIEPESETALQSKAMLSPSTCCVVTQDDTVIGYCLAHPWQRDTPPSLEQVLDTLEKQETLYLHDIAFSAKARGLGAGTAVFDRLLAQAKRLSLPSISLVAVGGAHTYWQRLGFKSRIIDKSLDSYPDDACYMVYAID
ncbi:MULTISPECIES: GNAT family N-acetyltransferase [Shewanella]|uniref:GNAT family N-acetyltransferase n=1 Tax=Shewanella marisflavi TaxID=260364 RepID=A0ABX5WNZ1_9GAMM|nr:MULTISPECIES: GNAT family N-acetyltransferase [Shewanella]QDF76283.1 GNAT family N-acetyltransferase [Shewanella marisflavi]